MIELFEVPKGMKLTVNEKRITAIQNRLTINEGYCPCIPHSFDIEEFKCPCEKARMEMKCCCGLYEKK